MADHIDVMFGFCCLRYLHLSRMFVLWAKPRLFCHWSNLQSECLSELFRTVPKTWPSQLIYFFRVTLQHIQLEAILEKVVPFWSLSMNEYDASVLAPLFPETHQPELWLLRLSILLSPDLRQDFAFDCTASLKSCAIRIKIPSLRFCYLISVQGNL